MVIGDFLFDFVGRAIHESPYEGNLTVLACFLNRNSMVYRDHQNKQSKIKRTAKLQDKENFMAVPAEKYKDKVALLLERF